MKLSKTMQWALVELAQCSQAKTIDTHGMGPYYLYDHDGRRWPIPIRRNTADALIARRLVTVTRRRLSSWEVVEYLALVE